MWTDSRHARVDVRGDTALIYLSDRSDPIVAAVLATDTGPDGRLERVYLDRLVHPPGGGQFSRDWTASGAVSTVLERIASAE